MCCPSFGRLPRSAGTSHMAINTIDQSVTYRKPVGSRGSGQLGQTAVPREKKKPVMDSLGNAFDLRLAATSVTQWSGEPLSSLKDPILSAFQTILPQLRNRHRSNNDKPTKCFNRFWHRLFTSMFAGSSPINDYLLFDQNRFGTGGEFWPSSCLEEARSCGL